VLFTDAELTVALTAAAQVRAAVGEHAGSEGGRLRRQAVVLARAALVQAALAALPPWIDPDAQREADAP